MRTVVDSSGCTSTPGPDGLHVSGEFVVDGANVVEKLDSTTKKVDLLAQPVATLTGDIDKLQARVESLAKYLDDIATVVRGLQPAGSTPSPVVVTPAKPEHPTKKKGGNGEVPQAKTENVQDS